MKFNDEYKKIKEDMDTLDQLTNFGFGISDAVDSEIEERGITDKLEEIVFYRKVLINISKYVSKNELENAINDIKSINN